MDGRGGGFSRQFFLIFMQICGLENYATSNGFETRQLVAAHLEGLRATECFRQSRIVLVPEANLGNEAQEVTEHVLEMAGLTVLSQRDDAYGVYTSPGLPRMYVFRFGDLLAHDAVSYHAEMVTVNPFQTGVSPADRRAGARREFERQLRSFRRIHLLPKALSSRVSVAFTGKADKDNQRTNRLKDDMCMALLFGVYWSGQHKNGLVQERGYGQRFVRPDGVPIAPVTRPAGALALPAERLASVILPPGGGSSGSSGGRRPREEPTSELDSYAGGAKRPKSS